MPIYVYQCQTCQKVQERFQKLDDPAPWCVDYIPASGTVEALMLPDLHAHGPMQKLMTAPAFNFANGQGTDMGNTMAIPGYPLPPTE